MTQQHTVYPHGSVERISDDVFMVRGSIKMNPVVRITRNMAIVRKDDELTLINPLCVNEAVEKEIEALGKISHIIRLGAFHGVDDPYYVKKYGAKMWAQEGGTTYTSPSIDSILVENGALPFDNGTILEIKGSVQPECVILLAVGNGLLLSCDAIQNYGDYSYNNFLTSLMMPFIGFPKATIVGPIWLKYMTPKDGDLESEFRRITQLKFDSLLAAHGTLLEAGAKASVTAAIDKAFAKSTK